VLIGKLFAFGGATGLALAVARRARAIFWSVAGAVCLVFLSRTPRRIARSVPNPNNAGEAQDRTRAAVILADGLFGYCGPHAQLPAVGKTPVLLRLILGLRKAGFSRIVIFSSPLTRPFAQMQYNVRGVCPIPSNGSTAELTVKRSPGSFSIWPREVRSRSPSSQMTRHIIQACCRVSGHGTARARVWH